MTDDDNDDTNLGLAVTRSAASDPFTMLFNLLALLADSRAFKRSLQGLHRAMVSADEGTKRLAADRAAFADYERTTRGELERREGELDDREVSLKSIKDRREWDLADREARIADLERQWKFDPDEDVRRGFRAPQFSALQKARAARGLPLNPAVTTPPSLRPAFLQSDDARRDGHGVEFLPGSTLTRGP